MGAWQCGQRGGGADVGALIGGHSEGPGAATAGAAVSRAFLARGGGGAAGGAATGCFRSRSRSSSRLRLRWISGSSSSELASAAAAAAAEDDVGRAVAGPPESSDTAVARRAASRSDHVLSPTTCGVAASTDCVRWLGSLSLSSLMAARMSRAPWLKGARGDEATGMGIPGCAA